MTDLEREAVEAVCRRIGYAVDSAREGNIRSAAHSIGEDADDLIKIAEAQCRTTQTLKDLREIIDRDAIQETH